MIQCEIIKQEIENTPENRLYAAAKLGEIAFKLYIYLDSYPTYTIKYERLKFVKTIDTNYKSADKAFQTLLDEGYLIFKENRYFFIPHPEEKTRIQFQDDNLYTESMNRLSVGQTTLFTRKHSALVTARREGKLANRVF